MTLNCVIIDDEPLAAELLANYAKKIPYLNLIGTFNSAITAMGEIRNNVVDLVFLDIQMPELSGLEFAKLLPKYTKVVFTTAFKEYGLDGYKVNALDYLIKPISFEDFESASKKAYDEIVNDSRKNDLTKDGFIFIKSDYKQVKLFLDDILYIEGVKDYVKFYVKGKEPIQSLMNMKKLEYGLPKDLFMRVHRSYIVNLKKIELIDRLRIVYGETFIPISESYKQQFLDYVANHSV